MGDALAYVRAVHLLATLVIVGVVLFRIFVAEPALGCLPSSNILRLRALSRAIVMSGLLIAVISGAAWIALLAARLSEAPESFPETLWALLTETQFGLAWQLRLGLAILWAIVVAGEDAPGRNAIAVGISALFAATLAWSGHGAATPGAAGYVHILADMVHLIAAAAWLGSLVPLVLLMGWLMHRGESAGALTAVLHRYSTLGILAVTALVASGITNVFFTLSDTASLLASNYGRVLLAKLVLFIVMLGFATVNRSRLTPALAASAVDGAAAIAWRIRRNALAEIVLGVAIVMLVGWLGIMAPGEPSSGHMH